MVPTATPMRLHMDQPPQLIVAKPDEILWDAQIDLLSDHRRPAEQVPTPTPLLRWGNGEPQPLDPPKCLSIPAPDHVRHQRVLAAKVTHDNLTAPPEGERMAIYIPATQQP